MSVAEKLRLDIMQSLLAIDDVPALMSLNKTVSKFKSESSAKHERPQFMEAVVELKDDLPLSQLMEAQDYRRVSYQQFRKNVDAIEWGVSLDELLDSLN